MCGRAAQTYQSVAAAANSLGVNGTANCAPRTTAHSSASTTNNSASNNINNTDNYNLSPGMDAIVIWKGSDGTLQMGRKIWGLVTRPGSKSAPLPKGMKLHFSNLMFNARSDTLYEKVTFSRLAAQGRSCLIALDGFFEWREEGKGNKQPYFVYRKQGQSDGNNSTRPYLLMPGLWTSVATGRGDDDPILDTFTIVTTDVCQPLSWLHTRMPVCIWDEALALQWLDRPLKTVHDRLVQGAIQTPENILEWHPVSKEMTSMKFRSADALKPIKLNKISSFFKPKASDNSSGKSPATPTKVKSPSSKRPIGSAEAVTSPETKKAKTIAKGEESKLKKKKGPLDSFFSPKK